MNMTRLLAVIGIFIATAGIAAPVSADTYPARPIQMIVPFPPGGSTDVMARVLAARCRIRWANPSWCRTVPAPAA